MARITRRNGLCALFGMAPVVIAASRTGRADVWPSRPITLVVTYAAGGAADTVARIISGDMAAALGQSILIENRPGGGGIVASGQVARSAPDGYTLQIGAVSTHAIAKQLFGDKLGYDPVSSFTPISHIQSQPNLMLVGKGVPATDIGSFVAWARKQQQPILYGTAGIGSSPHLAGALIGEVYGLKMQMVAYRGSAQALLDLAAGQVPVVIDNIVTAAPLAVDGRATAIAVTSPGRSAMMPGVPSFVEAGAAAIDLVSWMGVFGPVGLPAPIAARIAEAVKAALRNPAVRRKLIDTGCDPVGNDPADFADFVRTEVPKWSRLVSLSGADQAVIRP